MTSLVRGAVLQDRYEIVGPIGQGGMGAVYEAVQGRLKRRVAVKQLLIVSEARRSRAFLREAQILANLEHRALPDIIDYFTDDAGHFLVMDFIPGNDLAVQLAQRDGPFPVDLVMQWADEVLDVLDYLHTQQIEPIYHGDIKPHNLKLRPSGEIMLLDFGLAKGYLAEMTHVAGESSIVGYTPGYSPPEQVDGTGTDGRSDLYALGATIHQLLTKSPPVDERSRWRAVGRGRPDPLKPVHTLNPLVPPEVSEVLVQALALERDERPPTATAMRAALRAAYRGAGTALASAVPAPPPAHENDATATDAAPLVSRDDPVAIEADAQQEPHHEAEPAPPEVASSDQHTPSSTTGRQRASDGPTLNTAAQPAASQPAAHLQPDTDPAAPDTGAQSQFNAASAAQAAEIADPPVPNTEIAAPRHAETELTPVDTGTETAASSAASDESTDGLAAPPPLPFAPPTRTDSAASAPPPATVLPHEPEQAPSRHAGAKTYLPHDQAPTDATVLEAPTAATVLGPAKPAGDTIVGGATSGKVDSPGQADIVAPLPELHTEIAEPQELRAPADARGFHSLSNASTEAVGAIPAPPPETMPRRKQGRLWALIGAVLLLLALATLALRSPLSNLLTQNQAPAQSSAPATQSEASVQPSTPAASNEPTPQPSAQPSASDANAALQSNAGQVAEAASPAPLPPTAVAETCNDNREAASEAVSAEEHVRNGSAAMVNAQYDLAIGEFSRAIEHDPRLVDAYINRGEAFHMQAKYGCAIEDYNRALEVDPHSILAYNFRGNAYAVQQDDRPTKDYSQAIKDYTRAIELCQEQNLPYAAPYLNRALVRFAGQEYDLAVDDYSSALEQEPDDAKKKAIYFGRGQVYSAKQQYDQAISDFDEAIERDQNFAEAYFERGLAHKSKGGDAAQQQAAADFRKVLELSSDPELLENAENELRALEAPSAAPGAWSVATRFS